MRIDLTCPVELWQYAMPTESSPECTFIMNNLSDKVDLGGTFCMGNCQKGVCVTIDDKFYSVTPETVADFFEQNVKEKV